MSNLSLLDSKRRYTILVDDKCGSLWFHIFTARGYQTRMGVIWEPNTVLSTKLIIEFVKEVEARNQVYNYMETGHMWMVFVLYTVLSCILFLRGNEGLLLDLYGNTKIGIQMMEPTSMWLCLEIYK